MSEYEVKVSRRNSGVSRYRTIKGARKFNVCLEFAALRDAGNKFVDGIF